jgi:hypothetical protein
MPKARRGRAGRPPDGAAARAGVSEPGSAVLRPVLGDRDREAGGAAHQAAGAASDLERFSRSPRMSSIFGVIPTGANLEGRVPVPVP